jgi:hypothetical protein
LADDYGGSVRDMTKREYLQKLQHYYYVKNYDDEDKTKGLDDEFVTEEDYEEADREWEESGDAALWDGTVGDGIK